MNYDALLTGLALVVGILMIMVALGMSAPLVRRNRPPSKAPGRKK